MRKLLGYRLKSDKEEYREAAERIANGSLCLRGKSDYFHHNSSTFHELKQAGVMHWFEEVYEEDELEVGKWYKDEGYLVCFQGYNTLKSYGFKEGKWTTSWTITRDWEELEPATTEEIQQALIKEAKKRGFKEGVKYSNPQLSQTEIGKGKIKLSQGLSHLYFSESSYMIFYNGKWAEILPSETLNGKTAIIDGVEYELKIK